MVLNIIFISPFFLVSKENKENRPDGERGRGRGRGRGGIGRGRGFTQQFDNTRPTFDQVY